MSIQLEIKLSRILQKYSSTTYRKYNRNEANVDFIGQ